MKSISKEGWVTIGIIAAWVLLALIAFEAKARVAFIGLPIVTLIFVCWLIWMTVSNCRPSSLTENNETKENK